MVVEIAEFMRINRMKMDFRSIPKFLFAVERCLLNPDLSSRYGTKKRRKNCIYISFQDKVFSQDISSELSLTLHEGNRNKFEVKRCRFVTSR